MESLYWEKEGHGQNIILLHGWGMNGAVWHQAKNDYVHIFVFILSIYQVMGTVKI